jgi:hypothetical protein
MFTRLAHLLIAAPVFAAEPKAPTDLGIELIAIRAGSFTIGSPSGE